MILPVHTYPHPSKALPPPFFIASDQGECGNLQIIKALWDCFGRFTPSQWYTTHHFKGERPFEEKWPKFSDFLCEILGYNVQYSPLTPAFRQAG